MHKPMMIAVGMGTVLALAAVTWAGAAGAAAAPQNVTKLEARTSLKDLVAKANVIVVVTVLDSAPVPPNQPGDLPEVSVRWKVARVLKGNIAEKAIATRKTAGEGVGELKGKEWIVFLTPEYLAGMYRYAAILNIKEQDTVRAIVAEQAVAREVARLIDQLGSETAAARDAAQKALVKIGLPAVEALRAAVADKNVERAARARDTLRQIEQSPACERIRQMDERLSAMMREWSEAGGAKAGPGEDEIRRLIEHLGAASVADRAAAQKALVKIGPSAAEALAAATDDKNAERALRARDALGEMPIRKEDWPISWRDMTFSYKVLSPDPNECMALTVDAQRRAVFIQWDPAGGAFTKAQATLSQEDADMLHAVLGRLQLWATSEAIAQAAPAIPARIELTVTVAGRFARVREPWPLSPANPIIARLKRLDEHILVVREIIRKQQAVREQSAKARPAAEGGHDATAGNDAALALAEKLVAEARRLGKPLPTGDTQELYGPARAGAMDAWNAADEAQAAYEKAYGRVGRECPPGKADPNTPAAAEAFAKVERLYLDAIEKLGANEYGADAQQYLANAYRYAGRKDRSEEWGKRAEQTKLVAGALKELARRRREGGDWPELAAVMRLLHNPADVSREELAGPLANLGKRSDEAVAKMTEEFWQPSNLRYRWRVIWSLGLMNTPVSRKALLALALEGGHKDDRGQIEAAAGEYLKLLPDKAGAKPLLAAPDAGVVKQAIVHLICEPIDKEMLDRLLKLMKSGDQEMQFLIVQNFGQDPAGQFVAEKVAATVEAIPNIAKMPSADQPGFMAGLTNAESRYSMYIGVLSKLTNPPQPVDRALAAAEPGSVTWRCMVLARGYAGDAKVRPDVRKILADAEAGMFRAWACEALGKIGSAEDLPLLRDTAAKDPLQRKRGGCIAPMNQELYHPVREAAAQAVKLLEPKRAE